MHRRRAATALVLVTGTLLLVMLLVMDSGAVSARRLPSPPSSPHSPQVVLPSGGPWGSGSRSRLMHERSGWRWEEKPASVGSLTATARRLLGQRKPGSPPSPNPHGMTTMFRPLPPPPVTQ